MTATDRASNRVERATRGVAGRVSAMLQFRIWYGIGAGTWARLLAQNGRSITAAHTPIVILFTLLSVFNSSIGILSRLIFAKRIRQVRLDSAPLFILGHWRTGSTYLHELLSCDDRFIAPKGYQCGAPLIFLASETTFRPLLKYFMPRRRPMDDMALNLERAQEDEYAMLGLAGHSLYKAFIFPSAGPVDREYLSLRHLTPELRRTWVEAWVYFLKSVAIRHGGSRKLLLKSPQHTARVRTILSVFPEAKFVHLTRDPIEIYASTLRTWRALSDTQGLQGPGKTEPWLVESVLSTFEEMYACYQGDRSLIAQGNLVELRYEELVADPEGAIGRIYRGLELGDTSHFALALRARVAESSEYRVSRYRVSREEVAVLAARWTDYIGRYDYGDAIAAALAAENRNSVPPLPS